MLSDKKVGKEGLSVTKNKAQDMHLFWNSGTANAHSVSRSLKSSQQRRCNKINKKIFKNSYLNSSYFW